MNGFVVAAPRSGSGKTLVTLGLIAALRRRGLAVAAVHEVFAEGHQSATATGFIAGLSARISPRRPLVWIRQKAERSPDMAEDAKPRAPT